MWKLRLLNLRFCSEYDSEENMCDLHVSEVGWTKCNDKEDVT